METYRFEFVSATGHLSACHLQVFAPLSLVVATYTGEGTSVTNECERIALAAVRRHRLNPDRLLFIEHYPDLVWEHYTETFKLITFTLYKDQFTYPVWTELDNLATKELLRVLTPQHS